MRIIFEHPTYGLINAAGVNNPTMVGGALRAMPGPGQPFLVFPDGLLAGPVVMADFNLYPQYVVSSDLTSIGVAENAALISAMLATPPLDAVVTDPPTSA